MKAELIEADGMIHAINMTNAEFTLCGDAFDISAVDDSRGEWSKPTRRTVDCEACVTIIRSVRGLRTI